MLIRELQQWPIELSGTASSLSNSVSFCCYRSGCSSRDLISWSWAISLELFICFYCFYGLGSAMHVLASKSSFHLSSIWPSHAVRSHTSARLTFPHLAHVTANAKLILVGLAKSLYTFVFVSLMGNARFVSLEFSVSTIFCLSHEVRVLFFKYLR